MARLDSRPLDDPFVGRLDPLGELGIGNAAGRQGGARADDDGAAGHLAATVSRCAEILSRSWMILRVRSSRTIRAATRIALATALSGAVPWRFAARQLGPETEARCGLFG